MRYKSLWKQQNLDSKKKKKKKNGGAEDKIRKYIGSVLLNHMYVCTFPIRI